MCEGGRRDFNIGPRSEPPCGVPPPLLTETVLRVTELRYDRGQPEPEAVEAVFRMPTGLDLIDVKRLLEKQGCVYEAAGSRRRVP